MKSFNPWGGVQHRNRGALSAPLFSLVQELGIWESEVWLPGVDSSGWFPWQLAGRAEIGGPPFERGPGRSYEGETSVRGSVNEKFDPWPRMLWTLISPPWSSMMDLVIARPSPVPPTSWARLSRDRKNLVKSCS